MRKDLSKLERIVKLEGCIEVLSALHIGKGRAIDAGALSDMPVIKDFPGYPFIPGSSFKGVVRSFIESFIRGFNSPNIKTCNLIDEDHTNCIDPKDESVKNMSPEKKLEKLCTVCGIFGHPLVASRIRFLDLPVKKDTWHELMLQIRDGVVIDRESGVAKEGGKYDFETIPAGVKFKLEVFIENPENWELGLLFFAIDSFNNGYGFLGGNASRGLGKVKINIEKCTEATPQTLIDRKIEEINVEEFKKKCLEELKKKAGGDNAKSGS
ncbi:MAG: CRISPR-associated RAMP protein Csx7 [Acidobacteriota bacterium]